MEKILTIMWYHRDLSILWYLCCNWGEEGVRGCNWGEEGVRGCNWGEEGVRGCNWGEEGVRGCNWGEEGVRGQVIRKRKEFSKAWWHTGKKKFFYLFSIFV